MEVEGNIPAKALDPQVGSRLFGRRFYVNSPTADGFLKVFEVVIAFLGVASM